MSLFEDWCDQDEEGDGSKRLWKLTEKEGGREAVRDRFYEAVRSHYDDLARMADSVEALGYDDASAILRMRFPQSARARSGELGELIACELIDEKLDYRIPVKPLRYKDGREMALRGDDFIGIGYDEDDDLCLLKGEAKSRATLGATTITEARTMLRKHGGRPDPTSLIFVMDRLLEGQGDDRALGVALREEIARRAVPASRIEHVLFTLSGNAPPAALATDLAAADNIRTHTVINFRINGHQAFIGAVYEEAGILGDD